MDSLLESQKNTLTHSKSDDEKDPRVGSRRKIELVMTPEQELQQLNLSHCFQQLGFVFDFLLCIRFCVFYNFELKLTYSKGEIPRLKRQTHFLKFKY